MKGVFFSLIGPLVLWLLFGAPSLAIAGNLVLFAAMTCHLLAVIWSDSLFRLVGGDTFTYGSVNRALTGVSFLVTAVAGGFALHAGASRIQSVGDVPAYVWGVLLMGLVITITVPLLSAAPVGRLPKSSDRRGFEDPHIDP
ncbi:MAG: hypothetical protein WCO67_06120 [Betaproteobacteria bacterium]